MAQVAYVARARAALERLLTFLEQADPVHASEVLAGIAEAVELLERHPLMGRPAAQDYRELVISRGKTGYVALYRYDHEREAVVILALRPQREAGFVETE